MQGSKKKKCPQKKYQRGSKVPPVPVSLTRDLSPFWNSHQFGGFTYKTNDQKLTETTSIGPGPVILRAAPKKSFPNPHQQLFKKNAKIEIVVISSWFMV